MLLLDRNVCGVTMVIKNMFSLCNLQISEDNHKLNDTLYNNLVSNKVIPVIWHTVSDGMAPLTMLSSENLKSTGCTKILRCCGFSKLLHQGSLGMFSGM